MASAVVAANNVIPSTSIDSLPGPIPLLTSNIGLKIFGFVRTVWYLNNKWDTYTNLKNTGALAAGHLANMLAGDNQTLRKIARCINIAHKVMKSIDQTLEVHRACSNWIPAVTGKYSIKERFKWKMNEPCVVFSPSTVIWARTTWSAISERISQIFFKTFDILKQIFFLTMRVLDAKEAFDSKSASSRESIPEIFTNSEETLSSLSTNGDRLVKLLRENLPAIVHGISSSISSDYVIYTLESIVSKIKTVDGLVKKGNGILLDAVQRTAIGFLSTIGGAEHTPEFLVPKVAAKQRVIVPIRCYAPPAALAAAAA